MKKIIVVSMIAFSITGCNQESLEEHNYKECISMYKEMQDNNFFKNVSKEDACECIAERQTDMIIDELKYTDISLYSNVKKSIQAMFDQYYTVAMYDCNNELSK